MENRKIFTICHPMGRFMTLLRLCRSLRLFSPPLCRGGVSVPVAMTVSTRLGAAIGPRGIILVTWARARVSGADGPLSCRLDGEASRAHPAELSQSSRHVQIIPLFSEFLL
jgi:hypothetical protein